MLDWIIMPLIRRDNRKRWRDGLSRESGYAEIAMWAATHANAAQEGGYDADARILIALADTLVKIGKSPDAEAAIKLMRTLT